MENAMNVENDLKECFAQDDFVRISELMQEIFVSQQDSKSVTTFYSELKVLWKKLEIYLPRPSCSCRTRCSCESMPLARKNHLLLYAMRFLTGLNENLSTVKSQILLMYPLPPMNRISSMVHEIQGNLAPNVIVEDTLPSINPVNTGKFKNGYSGNMNKSSHQGFNSSYNKLRVCSFCGRTNHTVETCYKKQGYPPHLQRNYN